MGVLGARLLEGVLWRAASGGGGEDFATPPECVLCRMHVARAGTANGWATPYYRWNAWAPACTSPTATTFDGGLVCDNTVVVRRLSIDQVTPPQLDFTVRSRVALSCLATVQYASVVAT
jgi:hypothetical protein